MYIRCSAAVLHPSSPKTAAYAAVDGPSHHTLPLLAAIPGLQPQKHIQKRCTAVVIRAPPAAPAARAPSPHAVIPIHAWGAAAAIRSPRQTPPPLSRTPKPHPLPLQALPIRADTHDIATCRPLPSQRPRPPCTLPIVPQPHGAHRHVQYAARKRGLQMHLNPVTLRVGPLTRILRQVDQRARYGLTPRGPAAGAGAAAVGAAASGAGGGEGGEFLTRDRLDFEFVFLGDEGAALLVDGGALLVWVGEDGDLFAY